MSTATSNQTSNTVTDNQSHKTNDMEELACILYAKIVSMVKNIVSGNVSAATIRQFFVALDETKRFDVYYDCSSIRDNMLGAMKVYYILFSVSALYDNRCGNIQWQSIATDLIMIRQEELEYHFQKAINAVKKEK